MKKRFSGPQIVAKLWQAGVLLGQDKTVDKYYIIPCESAKEERLRRIFGVEIKFLDFFRSIIKYTEKIRLWRWFYKDLMMKRRHDKKRR